MPRHAREGAILAYRMGMAGFDEEFLELPDGVVTVVVRSQWPAAEDVLAALQVSVRRGPKRVRGWLREADANGGADR